MYTKNKERKIMLIPDQIDSLEYQRITYAIGIWDNRLRFLTDYNIPIDFILDYPVRDLVYEPKELTEWWVKNREKAYTIRNYFKKRMAEKASKSSRENSRPDWWDNYVFNFVKRFKR